MSFLLESVAGSERTAGRVEGGLLRIGRGTNADLRFEDASVALEHAEIVREAGGYKISDRGSLTGTYVNGKAIDEWRLADGDAIDIGPMRLTVRLAPQEEALRLEIRPLEEATAQAEPAAPGSRAGVPALAAPQVDYVAAYRLRKGPLKKTWIALALTLAAVVAALCLPIFGWTSALRPGEVSRAHAGLACTDCHAPWKGPTDSLCAACHGAKSGVPAPAHHAEKAAAPACGACHFEHRNLSALTAVENASCVACHRDLSARSRGPLAFARRVTSFAADHPDFAPGSAGALDPVRLRFDHDLHLKRGLRGLPPGEAELRCESCHLGTEKGGEPSLAYAPSCASCHRLTFDPRLPREVVPHRPPDEIHRFLVVAYAENPAAARSLFVDRRRILRGEARADLDLSPRVKQAVNEAELYLYRTACAECHFVDARAVPPRIEPTAMAGRRLPHARFAHADHRRLWRCVDCHASAASSRRAADVLLPGIATCRPCHGDGRGSGAAGERATRAATTECAACHEYHPRGEAPARRPAEADPGAERSSR
ncbi:MAG TPA: FHA domain-containing protein [Thermoanaerobaculia bacterium]|nr:FHA domain-containing protein [Thermoanaerobaculia bacterium]